MKHKPGNETSAQCTCTIALTEFRGLLSLVFWVTNLELGWGQGVATWLSLFLLQTPNTSFWKGFCVSGIGVAVGTEVRFRRITDNPVITFEIAFQINSHSFPTLQRREDQGRINSYEKNYKGKKLHSPHLEMEATSSHPPHVPSSLSPIPPVSCWYIPPLIHNRFNFIWRISPEANKWEITAKMHEWSI